MKTFPKYLAACAVVALALVGAPRAAEAKLLLFNWGDDIFTTGPLPAPYDRHPNLRGWEAGYKCSVVGLFWAYFHTWGCEPVAFKDDTYDDSPALVAAIRGAYGESDRQLGWWGKHGRWLFAGLMGLGVFVRDND